MYIKKWINLVDFEPWSGAIPHFKLFSREELEKIESILEEIYQDDIDETTLNDLFWFDLAFLMEILGIDEMDEEEFYLSRRNQQ